LYENGYKKTLDRRQIFREDDEGFTTCKVSFLFPFPFLSFFFPKNN